MHARLVPSRRPRTLAAVAAGLFAVLLAWSPVIAAVSWGDLHRASTNYAYGWTQALARTVTSGGTAYLHQVFTRDYIGGDPVEDGGPYLGIYYKRGNGSGSSWGSAKRLNSSTQHGDYGTVAATGKYVYAAWRRELHYGANYVPTEARQLKFRRNTNHGNADYWKPGVTFLGANYIDRPSISTSGSSVFIAYTDASGGEIRLQRSTDNGATFTLLEAIGATTVTGDEGYSGAPVVAVSGQTVAVIWNYGPTAMLRVSADGGGTWQDAVELDDVTYADASAAHRSGRIAFAWTTADARNVYVRLLANGTLGSTKTIVSVNDATTYKRVHTPAVALAGTSRIGVAYSACNTTGCAVGSTKGSSIRWLESGNNGSSWTSNKTIGSLATTSSRRINEYPSALYASTTRRLVSWTAAGQSSGSNYRIVIRQGLGSP
jgi:hypothetical protein